MLNWVTQTWKMLPHREHGESGHLSFSCFVLIIMITLWVTIALNSPVKRKLPHLLPRCLAMSRLNISLICWMIFFLSSHMFGINKIPCANTFFKTRFLQGPTKSSLCMFFYAKTIVHFHGRIWFTYSWFFLTTSHKNFLKLFNHWF